MINLGHRKPTQVKLMLSNGQLEITKLLPT